MSEDKFHLAGIEAVGHLIASCLRRTPLLPSFYSSTTALKAENLQNTHSFKVRPAAGQILSLTEKERKAGLVTSSSGNFGQAAAFVARRLGVPLKVVMTVNSNPLKVELTRSQGAEVVFCDDDFGARQSRVDEIEKETGASQIHPFEHPNAILGNATLGLEILRQSDRVENIVLPISGGGLIAGVALAVKLLRPSVRLWGVQPEESNAAFLSFHKGTRQRVARPRTIADGLRANQPGELTFSLMRRYVDDVVTVGEETISSAVAHFWRSEKLVVEPSGAVGLAALMEGRVPARDTVLVLSGGNLDPSVLGRTLSA